MSFRRQQVRLPFQWGMDGGLAAASVELGLPEEYLENYIKGQTNYKGETKSPISFNGAICDPVDEEGNRLQKPKKVEIHFVNDLGDIKYIVADYGGDYIKICTNTSARHRVGHVKRERQVHDMFLPVNRELYPILVPCCKFWRKDIKDGDTMTNSEEYYQNNEDSENAAERAANLAAAANDENVAPTGDDGGWGNTDAGASGWDAIPQADDDNNAGASGWGAFEAADDKPAAAAGGAVLGDITNNNTGTQTSWADEGSGW